MEDMGKMSEETMNLGKGHNISLTWIKAHLGMISLNNYDSSEVAVRSL